MMSHSGVIGKRCSLSIRCDEGGDVCSLQGARRCRKVMKEFVCVCGDNRVVAVMKMDEVAEVT